VTLACLILCSDGLLDLYDSDKRGESELDMAAMARPWIQMVGEESLVPLPSDRVADVKANLSLRLIYHGMSGGRDNLDDMSKMVTLEMEDKWMDDTTVIVQGLIL